MSTDTDTPTTGLRNIPVLRHLAPPRPVEPQTDAEPNELLPWDAPGSPLRRNVRAGRSGFYAPNGIGAPSTTHRHRGCRERARRPLADRNLARPGHRLQRLTP